MQITTTQQTATMIGRTTYSHSPVIIIGAYKCALTHEGHVYRALAYNEAFTACEPQDVAISDATAAMIAAEEQYSRYSGAHTPLRDKVRIQRILQEHGGYTSYMVQHEPLHALQTARYYDVLAIEDRSQRLAASKKEVASLREELAQVRAALWFVAPGRTVAAIGKDKARADAAAAKKAAKAKLLADKEAAKAAKIRARQEAKARAVKIAELRKECGRKDAIVYQASWLEYVNGNGHAYRGSRVCKAQRVSKITTDVVMTESGKVFVSGIGKLKLNLSNYETGEVIREDYDMSTL